MARTFHVWQNTADSFRPLRAPERRHLSSATQTNCKLLNQTILQSLKLAAEPQNTESQPEPSLRLLSHPFSGTPPPPPGPSNGRGEAHPLLGGEGWPQERTEAKWAAGFQVSGRGVFASDANGRDRCFIFSPDPPTS